jgi:deoxycytidylate deaminase
MDCHTARVNRVISKIRSKLLKRNPGIRNFNIGAAIIYKKRIISYGFNSICTHPFQKRMGKAVGNENKQHLHAETDAVLSAKSKSVDFSQCSIVVVRVLRNGTLAMAKPCDSCQHMLVDMYGFKTVIYTTGEHTYEVRYR